MKFRTSKLILLISLTALLSSCFPYVFTHAPGVKGKLLDSETNINISGATITRSSDFGPKQNYKLSTTSKDDGSFKITDTSKWGAYFIPMNPGIIEWNLHIEKEGYIEKNVVFKAGIAGPSEYDLGSIKLVRMESNLTN